MNAPATAAQVGREQLAAFGAWFVARLSNTGCAPDGIEALSTLQDLGIIAWAEVFEPCSRGLDCRCATAGVFPLLCCHVLPEAYAALAGMVECQPN